jgi:hypothetical protein
MTTKRLKEAACYHHGVDGMAESQICGAAGAQAGQPLDKRGSRRVEYYGTCSSADRLDRPSSCLRSRLVVYMCWIISISCS